MKYIIVKYYEMDLEHPMLFDEMIEHAVIYRQLGKPILVSAGFVHYDDTLADDFKMYCTGQSKALKTESHSGDIDIIKRTLNRW